MQTLPHRYTADAVGQGSGDVRLSSPGLADIASDAPAAFSGPGDRWSPETLLVAAVADCFVLTFRAVARAMQLPWLSVTCHVDGTLDRVDRAMQFTAFDVRAALRVPAGTSEDLARRALTKAEHTCLVSNSLRAERRLELDVQVES